VSEIISPLSENIHIMKNVQIKAIDCNEIYILRYVTLCFEREYIFRIYWWNSVWASCVSVGMMVR